MQADSNREIILLEDGWKEIQTKGLNPLVRILEGGFETNTKLFNNKEFVDIYTICYNMCTQRSPYNWSEQLYQRHGSFIEEYMRDPVVPCLKQRHDQFLLQELVKRGENHKIMNKWLFQFFQYLDRFYVKYHSLPLLEMAGVRKFKELVFDVIKADVCNAILALINQERDGAVIDRGLIKKCIELFESMGMGTLDVYNADLEVHLLNATREYYARKATAWIQDDSTPTYLIKTETAIDEERARVTNYLHPETEQKLIRVLEEEVLEKREMELLEKEHSGCRALLTNDMYEDLSRMYRLFARIPDGLSPISDNFRQHIVALGNEKIEQKLVRMEQADKKEEGNDDPQFIKDLLSIHEKYVTLVNSQFSGNALFQKSLKDAFAEIVNRDIGKVKIAELMSSFCDRILKSGSPEKLSESEIEEFLEKTVTLFSYLTDKDIFADYYRNQLAKRLLNQRIASDDIEKLMIGKLKSKCGAQFTSRLEGMLNDLSIGADNAKKFGEYCKNNETKLGLGKLEFTVQVLTIGHWPTYKALDINIPPVMQRSVQVFKEFYEQETTHRRLQWSYSLGNATVKGVFNKRSFELQVTTVQAVVLVAFNGDNGVRKFSELQESTNMTEDTLKRVLHSLAMGKYKVLIKSSGDPSAPADPKDAKNVKSTDVFTFNDQFTSQHRKFRIPMSSLDDSHNTKRVDEDRTVAVDAAIVRIMKARKTLSHTQLVAEVLAQLAFFRPEGKVVKKQIESLIDREYLERDTENSNTYKYLA